MSRSARERVLAALEYAGTRGCVTAELCQPEVGGERFGARIMELRGEGHRIDGARERQGSHRYTLITNGAEEGAGTGPAALSPPSAADPSAAHAPAAAGALLRPVVWEPGRYHACDACAFAWHDTPWPVECPNCKAGVHWIASYYSRQRAHLHTPLCTLEPAAA